MVPVPHPHGVLPHPMASHVSASLVPSAGLVSGCPLRVVGVAVAAKVAEVVASWSSWSEAVPMVDLGGELEAAGLFAVGGDGQLGAAGAPPPCVVASLGGAGSAVFAVVWAAATIGDEGGAALGPGAWFGRATGHGVRRRSGCFRWCLGGRGSGSPGGPVSTPDHILACVGGCCKDAHRRTFLRLARRCSARTASSMTRLVIRRPCARASRIPRRGRVSLARRHLKHHSQSPLVSLMVGLKLLMRAQLVHPGAPLSWRSRLGS